MSIEEKQLHTPAYDTAGLTALICAEVCQVCVPFYGDALRAIVLTGSMARGEGTIRSPS